MIHILDLLVKTEHSRQSIGKTLRLAGISQTMRRRLRREGIVYINTLPAKWETPLHDGDSLSVYIPFESSETVSPIYSRYCPAEDILFEDDFLLLLNKPAGLLMHATAKERTETLIQSLRYYYKKENTPVSLHHIHRLDKDTSGIVAIAKTPHIQHLFSKGLPMHKVYLGLTSGLFPSPYASIRWPIGRKENSIIERTCTALGKSAITDIKRIKANENYSLLRFVLHTGRTHQIRVHCAHLGFPLLGDDLYGGSSEHIKRQALHASSLTFIHPITKREIHATAPLPKDMVNVMINLD